MSFRSSLPMDSMVCSQARSSAGYVGPGSAGPGSCAPFSPDYGPPPPLISPLGVRSLAGFHRESYQQSQTNGGGRRHLEADHPSINWSPGRQQYVASPPHTRDHISLQRRTLPSTFEEGACAALDLSTKRPPLETVGALSEAHIPLKHNRYEYSVCPTLDPNNSSRSTPAPDFVEKTAGFAQTSRLSNWPGTLQNKLPHAVSDSLQTCTDVCDWSYDTTARVKSFLHSWRGSVSSERYGHEIERPPGKCLECDCEASNGARTPFRAENDGVGYDAGLCQDYETNTQRFPWSGSDDGCERNNSSSGDRGDRLRPGASNSGSVRALYDTDGPPIQPRHHEGSIEFRASVSWRVQPCPSSTTGVDRGLMRVLSAHRASDREQQQCPRPRWSSLPSLSELEGSVCVDPDTARPGLEEDPCEEGRSPGSAASTKYKKYLINRYCKFCH